MHGAISGSSKRPNLLYPVSRFWREPTKLSVVPEDCPGRPEKALAFRLKASIGVEVGGCMTPLTRPRPFDRLDPGLVAVQ
jgi:hypothetical protein